MANLAESASSGPHALSGEPRTADPLRERVQSLRLPATMRADGPSRSRAAWAIAGLLALLCVVIVLWAMWQRNRQMAAAGGSSGAQAGEAGKPAAPAPSSSAPSAAGDRRIALESKGYIIPTKQILVSPKVSGMLTKLNVLEGQRVKQGDILAQIEDTEYKAELARTEALVAAAQQACDELQRGFRPEEKAQADAELKEATAQRDYLKDSWERSKRLYANKVISQEQHEEVDSRYWATVHRVVRLENALALMNKGARDERRAMAKAELDRTAAEREKAKWRFDNCTIYAPISGTILKKNAEEGNIVNPIAFNGSFSICEMADLKKLEVDLAIQERDIEKIWEKQPCEVRTEAYPSRVYQGKVSRKMPIADRAKGTISVRVEVTVPPEEEGVYLKPEMGALVTFFDRGKPPAAADAKQK